MKIKEIQNKTTIDDIVIDVLNFSRLITIQIDIVEKLSYSSNEEVLNFCMDRLIDLLSYLETEDYSETKQKHTVRIKTIMFFIDEKLNSSERLE
jgi:hypothetical protein